MHHEVLIRKGTLADRDVIVAFDTIALTDPARVQLITRVLTSSACLVAECGGRVIGYAALEYTFFEQGFIPILYVAGPERRRGVGSALMRALVSQCRTKKIFTSTNESNKPMQELLETLRYVPSGIIENLDPGDPELVYCLELRGHAG
jgi:GNAT superfamily N-acetyltransferase